MVRLAKKVLLIGWDSADWRVINPLLDAGKLPHLQQIVERGVCGNLATLWPDYSPMLWTSISTGKRPYKHGVLGFVEPDPGGNGVRPITNLGRKTKAVWNILTQQGLSSHVVGWWPSFPAEPIKGCMVSNHFGKLPGSLKLPDGSLRPWPLPPGTVHPAEFAEDLAALRIHPQTWGPEYIAPIVPKFELIDQDKDHSLEAIAVSLAESGSMQAAITALMQNEPWDFATVYFNAVDHLSHPFMKYHPPRLPWIDERKFEIYSEVITGVYRFHDMLLGVLMALAGPEAHVIVMSDHGFEPGALRLKNIPREPAGIAAQHRPLGMIAMCGPGIKRDQRIYGGSLLDICPTLLALFGLPVGQDMDGRVLVEAFDVPPEVATIPSWDSVPGEDGRHPPNMRLDPVAAAESLQQLVDLGYIEAPSSDSQQAVRETVRELDFNLARSYMAGGLMKPAEGLLQRLVIDFPDEYRFASTLVNCLQTQGKLAEARAALDAGIARRVALATRARQEIEPRLKELEAAAAAAKARGEEPQELDEKTQRELSRLQAEASLNPWNFEFTTGSLLLEEAKGAEALEHFERCREVDADNPGLELALARAKVLLARWDEVETHCLRALELEPEYRDAHAQLARLYFRQLDFERATEQSLLALGLQYFDPPLHLLLGTALAASRRPQEAVAALKTAVRQNPLLVRGYRRLARVYENQFKDPQAAEEYQMLAVQAEQRLEDLRQQTDAASQGELAALGAQRGEEAEAEVALPELERGAGEPRGGASVLPAVQRVPAPPGEQIVVVSGLPRSGTSMMMQMLAAGGVVPLTDSQREADESNPRGYFEHEDVKKLTRGREWLREAQGKSLKVIAQLLPLLDPQLDYRVILMEREISEVLASQREMLARSGKEGAKLEAAALGREFKRQRAVARRWLEAQGIPVLEVSHRACLSDPATVAAEVAKFLDRALDQPAMAAAVSPELWRQREAVP
jgi:predicted AlkP superfamily phosphohydrolase/phosphomutase/predicted Zn-dependent protease